MEYYTSLLTKKQYNYYAGLDDEDFEFVQYI